MLRNAEPLPFDPPRHKKRARNVLRDREWREAVREMPCIFTGLYSTSQESVVPMHIGTAGKGMKSPDNEILPALNSFHQRGHNGGEMSMVREFASDQLLRAAFRAYARELYAEWKAGR